MRSSGEEAVDVLNGWRSSGSLVSAVLEGVGNSKPLVFGGTIASATLSSVTVAGGGYSVTLDLSSAEFSWHDPGEAGSMQDPLTGGLSEPLWPR